MPKEHFSDKCRVYSLSSLSSKEIVDGALEQGFSADEAVTVNHARKAYESNAGRIKYIAKTSNQRSYTVS